MRLETEEYRSGTCDLLWETTGLDAEAMVVGAGEEGIFGR